MAVEVDWRGRIDDEDGIRIRIRIGMNRNYHWIMDCLVSAAK